MAVFDVTYLSKKDSTINIDEFFHQVELDTMQMCYEFDLSCAINKSYLNEAEEEKENHMSKVKIFFAKLKEKIIDAAKKVIQWFTEKLTIITAKIEDKKRSKITNKYSKDEIKTVLSEIVPKYLESHKYYKSCFVDGLTNIYYKIEKINKNVFGISSVKDIMNIYDCEEKDKDEVIPVLTSTIDSNGVVYDIKKSISDTKKWRDEALGTLENLLKDDRYDEPRDYHEDCLVVMNIYMAGLKMRLENSKARIDMINLAEKELSKNKDKDDQKKTVEKS